MCQVPGSVRASGWEPVWSDGQTRWGPAPALPQACKVTLGQAFDPSEPSSPSLLKGELDNSPSEVLPATSDTPGHPSVTRPFTSAVLLDVGKSYSIPGLWARQGPSASPEQNQNSSLSASPWLLLLGSPTLQLGSISCCLTQSLPVS